MPGGSIGGGEYDNSDERKSGHGGAAAGAYGNEGGDGFTSAFTNPFNTPAWRSFFDSAGAAGGHGGGVPLGPSTPASMAETTAATQAPAGIAAAGGGMPFLHQALAMLAGSIPGLLSRYTGGGGGASGGIPPELRALLGQAVARTEYQNPLFQAATNQAFQGLPTYARDGLALGKFPGT